MSSAELWNGGQYELVAARFAEVHDALVEALTPQPGERWLYCYPDDAFAEY